MDNFSKKLALMCQGCLHVCVDNNQRQHAHRCFWWHRKQYLFPFLETDVSGISEVFGCMFSVQPKQELSGVIMGGCDGTVRASIPSTLPWFRRRSFSYLLRNADTTISQILDCPSSANASLSVQQTLVPTSEYYRFNATDHFYLASNYILILSC